VVQLKKYSSVGCGRDWRDKTGDRGVQKNGRVVDIECGVGKGLEGNCGRRNWAKRRRWIKYEGRKQGNKREGIGKHGRGWEYGGGR
jgi:hypothetical protein